MSEKILGFKEKDAFFALYKDWEKGGKKEFPEYTIDKSKLVPVVSLQAIKEWCMKEKQVLSFLIDHKEKYKQAEGYNKALNRILSWAEKEAKGNELGK